MYKSRSPEKFIDQDLKSHFASKCVQRFDLIVFVFELASSVLSNELEDKFSQEYVFRHRTAAERWCLLQQQKSLALVTLQLNIIIKSCKNSMTFGRDKNH